MIDEKLARMLAKIERIDERTENIQRDLKSGEERFKANEKRIIVMEKKQETHESQLRFMTWAGRISAALGLGAIVHYFQGKH